jgi:hypothetical protein
MRPRRGLRRCDTRPGVAFADVYAAVKAKLPTATVYGAVLVSK